MKKYLWLAGPALAAALLLWPGTALNAARAAMRAWATSVAPSLFPFMLLMPLLTCREASRAYERLLGPVMKCLFNLPGSAAPAVVIAMFAGSPAGARAIVRAAGNAGLSAAHAERMILCLCGVGPAFLTSGIGASMLQSAADGNLLMRAQLLTQLTLLLLTRRAVGRGDPLPADAEEDAPEPVGAAVAAVLNVCGSMAAFGVVSAFCARILRNEAVAAAVACVLDLPTGAAALAGLSLSRPVKLAFLAAAAGFGGLCIAAQNLGFCKNVGIRPFRYLASRVVSALLTAVYAVAQLAFSLPAEENSRRPLEISALIAVICAVPVLFSLANNTSFNKGNSRKRTEILPENEKKPQDVVEYIGCEILHIDFEK